MELLTSGQAAIRLKVGIDEVLRLCRLGRLAGAHKPGRDWMIPASACRGYERIRRPPGNPNFIRKARPRKRPTKLSV